MGTWAGMLLRPQADGSSRGWNLGREEQLRILPILYPEYQIRNATSFFDVTYESDRQLGNNLS
jgi:hypothetical protein